MEAKKFTWFPKFTRQLERVPEEHRLALAMAVMEYGTYGTEPDFADWGLAAVFEGMREDIDNSKAARYENKGGRPGKTGVSEGETGVSDLPKADNGGSEARNPIPNQTNTDHTSTSQSNPCQSRKGKGRAPFQPPTREEARAYLESLGLRADIEKIFDHYESNGWRCGRNPMKDWRAAFRRAAKEWAKGVPDADAEYADAI